MKKTWGKTHKFFLVCHFQRNIYKKSFFAYKLTPTDKDRKAKHDSAKIFTDSLKQQNRKILTFEK